MQILFEPSSLILKGEQLDGDKQNTTGPETEAKAFLW